MKSMDDFDSRHAFRMLRKQREAAQRGLPCPNFDDLLAEVLAEMGEEAPAAKRPTLVAVTPENAAQFKPAPKRRGRRPKVQLGGNVVSLAAHRQKSLTLPPAPCDRQLADEIRASTNTPPAA